MYSKLQTSIEHKKLAKRSQSVSFHAREHGAMATSPMKKWPSSNYCCSRRMIYLFRSRRRTCCGRQYYVPMMVLIVSYWARNKARKGRKTHDSSIVASTIPQLLYVRNTDLGCKFLSPIPGRFYMRGYLTHS